MAMNNVIINSLFLFLVDYLPSIKLEIKFKGLDERIPYRTSRKGAFTHSTNYEHPFSVKYCKPLALSLNKANKLKRSSNILISVKAKVWQS